MAKYFKMTAFIVLYLAVYFIISNYISSVAAFFYFIKEAVRNPGVFMGGTDSSNYQAVMDTILQNAVLYLIIAALLSFPIYMFILWLRKENIYKFCSFKKISIKNMIIVALLGATLNVVADFLIRLSAIDKLSPDIENLFTKIFEGNSLAMVLAGIGIIGPIIEEVIFRGLIFNEMRKHISTTAAIIIQALLFGAYHLNLTQGIYASVLGILLGLVFLWTRSIWASILVHIFFNSTSVLMGKLMSGEVPAVFGSVMLSICVLYVVIASAFLWSKRNRQQGDDHPSLSV